MVAIIIIAGMIPRVFAATYVGYSSSNLGGSTCGTNCAGTGATTNGIGQAVQAPFTGTLSSVSVYVATTAPNQVVIAIFQGTPAVTSYSCSGATCYFQNTGQSYTVKDVEGLSGLTTLAFNTINLASPVTVQLNDWVAIIFMQTSNTNVIEMLCGSGGSCGNSCPASCTEPTVMSNVGFAFATTSPSVGTPYTTTSSIETDGIVGGTFLQTGSTSSSVTQCYGNCGTPPVTLINTNSSHTTNFNQTITLLYEFQSNLNGFVVNVTTNVAKSYVNGQAVNLFLYTIFSCPTGQTPFSQQCPGQILSYTSSGPNPPKGKFSLTAGSRFPVSNGQWVGIGVSGVYSGLDLNDTNTNVPLFQVTNGKIPATITDPQALGNSKIGLWAWILGNVVTSLPPVTPSGQFCGFFDCLFGALINSFCSNVTVACQTSSGIFWAVIFTIMTVMTLKFGEAKLFGSNTKTQFGGEVFGLFFLAFIFLEAGLGLITAFLPIFFIMVIAVLFAKQTGRFF